MDTSVKRRQDAQIRSVTAFPGVTESEPSAAVVVSIGLHTSFNLALVRLFQLSTPAILFASSRFGFIMSPPRLFSSSSTQQDVDRGTSGIQGYYVSRLPVRGEPDQGGPGAQSFLSGNCVWPFAENWLPLRSHTAQAASP